MGAALAGREQVGRLNGLSPGRRRPRRGPRPLALHVSHAEMAWCSENPSQLTRFYDGIRSYRSHPYRRCTGPRPIVWAAGDEKLYDYGPETGWPLLIVPSMINRAYILDLMPGASLLERLSASGFRPFLLEWGQSEPSSRRLSIGDYVLGRLEPALSRICDETDALPIVLGYCMGGTLAVALSCLHQDRMAGLALLATPWDFTADDVHTPSSWSLARQHALAAAAGGIGSASVDLLQALFASVDPLAVPKKFASFARIDPSSSEALRFVAIEDWLNDGQPLGADVAAECFVDWYGRNGPAGGAWRIGGKRIRPEMLSLPAFFAIPRADRIVPPRSALALAAMLRNREVVRPASGHVGMIAGRRAEQGLWTPLADWLTRIAALQKKSC